MPEKNPDDLTQFGTLKVQGGTPLPEVLDVLIAGGGPAGTAAAVRAKEFGLSCLVIDYDDLMKRIRDYPKEKTIKPDYGGGDKLQFPAGGPLLASLYFDDIDKDAMVVAWKTRYKENGISAKIGSELTGLARLDGDLWDVRTWNHRAGKEVRYRARGVIIAMGAGVPRRFDIPGNTDGLAFRLDDAAHYIGAPALVIGGGTSAAEAVIAISNAKVNAEDPSPVYWSYRGDRLPKVSKALSEVFFDAYVGNGNIRYLAFSEPVAVVTAPDKNDYLSVLIDRREVAGRPTETVHLEFPKRQVVACIGEDLPVKFLQGLGIKIPLVNDRPLMLVSRDGELSLPNVFLVGDARGPKYLRCKDFNDSSTYEQITQKRNIKAAMVEAVEAIEVLAARAGKTASKIVREVVAPAPIIPPAPSEPADAHRQDGETQLVSLLPDGTPDERFPISKDSVSIGRAGSDITCAQDVYMADHHASVLKRPEGYVIEDTGTGSGVWIRAQGITGRPVGEGDVIWVGAQILMVTKDSSGWAVAHYNNDGVYQATYPIGDKGAFFGRGSGVTLDPADLSLSRRHAQFRMDGSTLKVFDLGSTNGTYVKITAPLLLANGDELRIASQRFRFETFAAVAKLGANDKVMDAPPPAPEPALAAAPAAAPVPAAALPEGTLAVAIDHPDTPLAFGAHPNKDILHAFFENLPARFPDCVLSKGVPAKDKPEYHQPLDWSCKCGICGLCAVEIVEGADNFLPVDRGSPEMDTIANKAALDADPKKYRLACLAKIKGPVKLTIPS
jgi:thioredoxin reductase/pSer/pThr/pTyr-binding forkhead associated (FHA) protein/ferredoxin